MKIFIKDKYQAETKLIKLFNKNKSTSALTELLGKLGIPSCWKEAVTFPSWTRAGGDKYIKYGLTKAEIHEFVERYLRAKK